MEFPLILIAAGIVQFLLIFFWPEKSPWIACADRLPELDEIVWLYEDGRIWIGSRADDGDSWLWANSYGHMWWNGTKWEAEAETDDDYKPTHWMPLPVPSKEMQAAKPAAPSTATHT